ncbi:hypothetical protein E8E15_007828 [Penicillium rubens]|jgi:hypothetical protein|uniref:Pc22g22350 protein n=2 Tax=Penicillium chrysogenum species complex TaxID=254878 RepID=B6HU72_PENRW|nr:uncharacterized protein N7525_004148 [Penicillium rubens]XP_056563309.1 uncharacterized protein N7489_009938 [Penicillium chrysogenum]CAP99523.1 Pc22g22350 [Penicillium rubens Wisconsin 54-1255]KAF3018056.1 hypothetical protein E8E15_007828 [Penicillium rubens]KAJ5045051.1 hypothetical protein NUH16_001863 [Penicillium rubens]KAJ5229230.1 hypothetical protein N7489_009938 [Penicillium chrysogenum]KAJ5258630.1 hypothetical protein N7524_010186 [Penicillium chrysogenum]
MLSQYPPRPRLTRLDNKHNKHGSFIPSISTSPSSPTAMTESSPSQSNPQPRQEHPPTCLSTHIEETLHLKDLELMMHWCTETYKSMAGDPTSERIWQTTIPQLSLRHPALRQGILALSALHLASTSTSSGRWRYLETARSYQAQALAGLRIESDEDAPEAESQATFALCCIMIVFTFGFCQIDSETNSDEEQPDVLDEFFEVFQLTRWLVSILVTSTERIIASELNPLLHPEDPPPTMPDMWRLVVLSLQRQNDIEAMRDPTHLTDLYDSAIEHLSHSLEQLMKGGEPKVFAFSWSFRIPAEFLELLEARRPFALVVLAHYAVILHHLRDSWWMGDWGNMILQEIGEILDPEWQDLINWPIDATGCFLPRTQARVRVVSPLVC